MEKRNRLVFSILVVFILTLLVGCHSGEEKLTIGMIPLREEAVMKEEFEPTRMYLEQQLEMPIEYVVTDNYAHLIEEMKKGTIDIGFYGAFSYVIAENDIELTPLVVQQRKGSGTYYQSLIITHKDSGIRLIEQLEGKSFAFVEAGSTSGFVLPYALLKSRNIDYEQYFKEHIYSGNHKNVILDIVSGKVDAGAISSIQFDYLMNEGEIQKSEFNILWRSGDIPSSPYVARNELKDEIKEKFINAMLNIHEEAPEALHTFDKKVEKYINTNNDHYNSIRNISTILGKEYMREQFLMVDH